MYIQDFEIQIIDTQDTNRSLLSEYAKFSSLKLNYDGEDTKNFSLFPSKLSFTMLVQSNVETTFLHLFTGNETRYKLKLISKFDTGLQIEVNTIWEGFLLPEQFDEPLLYADYFVSFVATDGMARLKQKTLAPEYYQEKKNVIEVLHACLALTGLQQPIIYAEALQNAGFVLDYKDLCVTTDSYDQNAKSNAYEILEYLSKGHRVFTFMGCWYVIGFNRLNELNIAAKKYPFPETGTVTAGEPVVINRSLLKQHFNADTMASTAPPLQKVTVNWTHNNAPSLIPEDLVTHDPLNFETDNTDRTPRYWQIATDAAIALETWMFFSSTYHFTPELPLDANYFGALDIRENFKRENGPFLSFSDSVSYISDLQDNYAYMSDAFYISGVTDLERFATVSIEWFIQLADNAVEDDVREKINNLDFNYDSFAVLRTDYKNDPLSEAEVYLDQNANFPFSLSVVNMNIHSIGSVPVLKGVLNGQKVLIAKDGWYRFVLYPSVADTDLKDQKVYTQLTFLMTEPSSEETVLSKNIDYTTEFDLSIFHSGSLSGQSSQRFLFSDSLSSDIVNGITPNRSYTITRRFYSKIDVLTGGIVTHFEITVGLSNVDYYNLKNGYQLHKGSGSTTEIDRVYYTLVDSVETQGKAIRQLVMVTENTDNYIEETDAISLVQDFNYSEHWIDKWRRYGVDESCSYATALSRMLIDINNRSLYILEGNYSLLVSPLDLITNEYDGQRNYIPSRISMALDRNTTQVRVLEAHTSEVEYTDESPQEPEPPQEAVITIESTLIYPNPFEVHQRIVISYFIQGVSPVAATLKAVQLTDSPTNNGQPTGLEKGGQITENEGFFTVNFPPDVDMGNEGGWYKITVNQGLSVSNVVYEQVRTYDEIVLDVTPSVVFIAFDLDASVNNNQRAYGIHLYNMTLDENNIVRQVIRDIDPITYELDLNTAIVSDITNYEDVQIIDFTGFDSGSYAVTVELLDQNNNTLMYSNYIAWTI